MDKYSHPPTQLYYRRDIDGLRSIAVLSVVFFHAFPEYFSGGFSGVDIFFVISGFLITSIILKELEDDKFSLTSFYERRIRRIFPPLILVMFVSLSFGYWALIPYDFAELGKHIAGGATFISNIILYDESGYFDKTSDEKPELHLWSLAVEEQFYIFWPIALLVSKKRFNTIYFLTIISTISFTFNIYLTNHNPSAAFYWSIPRFWELIIGGYLYNFVVVQHYNYGYKYVHNDLISFTGLCLLLFSVFIIDRSYMFPGWYALLPTFGAFMIIMAGPYAWLNKHILSSNVSVYIGLISYPIYLWHWPILSFMRIIYGKDLDPWIKILAIGCTFFLSHFTYILIEKPIRSYRGKGSLKLLLLMMFFLFTIGLSTYYYYNLKILDSFIKFDSEASLFPDYSSSMLNDGDIGHDIFHKYIKITSTPCTPDKILKDAEVFKRVYVRCYQSKPKVNKQIALIGDSHSEALFIGLAEALPNSNVVYYTKNELPLLSNPSFTNVFDYVIQDKDIKVVILNAFWGLWVENQPVTIRELNLTVRKLLASGKLVYLANDIPDFHFDPSACQRKGIMAQSIKCSAPLSDIRETRSKIDNVISSVIADNPSVQFINTYDSLCFSDSCFMAINGKILYRDRNHLNIYGSKYVGKYVAKAITK